MLHTFLIQEEDLFKKSVVTFNQNRFKLQVEFGQALMTPPGVVHRASQAVQVPHGRFGNENRKT